MQLQCVALRMEIPGLSNNTTENLKQKKIVEPLWPGAADRARQARRGHGFHTGPPMETGTRLSSFGG